MDLATLAASLERLNSDRLAQYWERATPKQLAFHRSEDALGMLHPRRLLRSGNQTGKSSAGAVEAWCHAIGRHPFHRVNPSPGLGFVLVADLENHYPMICTKLRESEPSWALSPATSYDAGRGYRTRGRRLIEVQDATGKPSLIEFRSGEGSTVALAGATISWLWIDEVPTERSWSEALSRVSVRRGPVWLTMTPIGRPTEYLRRHICGGPNGEPPNEEWSQTVIKLTPEDCPHRSPESIEAQVNSYLESERLQRVEGAWEGVSPGRLFSGWGPHCLLEEDQLPHREVGIGLTWDHGEAAGRELCLLYAYDEETREAWILDECASEGRSTVDQDAMAALEMLERNGLSIAAVDRAHGDVNSPGKNSVLTSVNKLLEEAIARCLGMPTSRPPINIVGARKGPGSVMMGCRVVNNALLSGRLFVSPKCTHLIKGLRHWRGGKTGAEAELTHSIDALRYALVDVLDPRARGAHRLAVR